MIPLIIRIDTLIMNITCGNFLCFFPFSIYLLPSIRLSYHMAFNIFHFLQIAHDLDIKLIVTSVWYHFVTLSLSDLSQKRVFTRILWLKVSVWVWALKRRYSSFCLDTWNLWNIWKLIWIMERNVMWYEVIRFGFLL